MKILFVCSGNNLKPPVFILQQQVALEERGIVVDYFKIKGKGIAGYLKNYFALSKKIKTAQYQLVHGHYGLSGLLACFQRSCPVVVSFYGSDLNNKKAKPFSRLASRLATGSIAVSRKLIAKLPRNADCVLIPCSVDTSQFYPIAKSEARARLAAMGRFQFDPEKKYILFASRFDRPVKNPALAFAAMQLLGSTFELIEFKNFTEEQVVLFFNAADALLLTSGSEGSPQVIKEAMACNRPVVSTDVGDVKAVTRSTSGCFIATADAGEIAAAITKAVQFEITNGREKIGNTYDVNTTTQRIMAVYNHALEKGNKTKTPWQLQARKY